ncbi:MAG: hypothetical protein IJ992_00260 [Lentisphaeria bacterium]|nr:hypothetical protein [Lentisphaeria bacterium]
MLKQIFRNILASVALLTCTTSCCVADWYHDWVYGDEPPPTDPIAPAPGGTATAPAYTPAEIVTIATDNLIFFFTANGIRKPGVACEFLLLDGELFRIGTRIHAELAGNKVISTVPDKVEYLLQFSREGKDGIRIALLKVDEKKVLFSEQYKLKEVK